MQPSTSTTTVTTNPSAVANRDDFLSSSPCRETATTMVENLAKLSAGNSMKFASMENTKSDENNTAAATASTLTSSQSQQAQQHEETVFSAIGLGILPTFCRMIPQQALQQSFMNDRSAVDSYSSSEGEDATEAACKAVQDAMVRGVLAFTSQQHQNQRPQLSIRIGVPMKLSRPQELMQVDQFKIMNQLNALQQEGVELSHIETVAGGLWVEQYKSSTSHQCATNETAKELITCRGILSVVACLSVVKARRNSTASPPASADKPHRVEARLAPTKEVAAKHSKDHQLSSHNFVLEAHQSPAWPIGNHNFNASEKLMAKKRVLAAGAMVPGSTVAEDPGEVTPSSQGEGSSAGAIDYSTMLTPSRKSSIQASFDRTSSMDVLAHVSAEIHDRQPKINQGQASVTDAGSEGNDGAVVYADKYGNNTNYKKLPPGKTPKNNNRLFVKHLYRDYSLEKPTPEEQVLLSERTPNAAFPLKLHETLLEIEKDGCDDVVGWLSHGRSFKIHKQEEFVNQILPKYFVMTKKSSFLRQLNLYGFNRLSGVGPDQGSYYHESFLRGMKFLCRRMQRCKVNGNRIRAAGNPDEEPVLSNFPTCPPVSVSNVALPLMATQTNPPAASVQQLASAAVLQLMASQNAPESAPLSAPPSLSSLFGMVPSSAATTALLAKAAQQPFSRKPPGEVANVTSLLVRDQTKPFHGTPLPSSILEGQLDDSTTKRQDCGSSMSSASSTETPNNSSGKSGGAATGGNGSCMASFPLKLQRILDKLEAEGYGVILSWLPHGRAFMVHNSERLVNELMPLYFNQTKYSSFQRQLHMYNFQRITTGRDKGAYHHPQFLRGRPALCQKMARTRVNGKGTRQPGNPQTEPDFYKLPPMPKIPLGAVVEIPQLPYPCGGNNKYPVAQHATKSSQQPQQRDVLAAVGKPPTATSVSCSSSTGADSEDDHY